MVDDVPKIRCQRREVPELVSSFRKERNEILESVSKTRRLVLLF